MKTKKKVKRLKKFTVYCVAHFRVEVHAKDAEDAYYKVSDEMGLFTPNVDQVGHFEVLDTIEEGQECAEEFKYNP